MKVGEDVNDLCQERCASCLAAKARGLIDREEYGVGFNSREDICMLDARDILADKLGWEIN